MYLTCLFIESKKTTKNRIENQPNSVKIENKNNVVSVWFPQRAELRDILEILLTLSSFCKKNGSWFEVSDIRAYEKVLFVMNLQVNY